MPTNKCYINNNEQLSPLKNSAWHRILAKVLNRNGSYKIIKEKLNVELVRITMSPKKCSRVPKSCKSIR